MTTIQSEHEGWELPLFDLDAFSDLVCAKMSADGLSYRQAAPAAGVSPATLNRIATAKGPPDVESYLRICRWLSPPPVSGGGPSPDLVLVPREPTEEMRDAAAEAFGGGYEVIGLDTIWTAMLSALPAGGGGGDMASYSAERAAGSPSGDAAGASHSQSEGGAS